ncbi:MAG: energy transducer TonB [Acetobacteraceae bacterium]
MDQTLTPITALARPWRPSQRRGSLGKVVVISAWLHLTLLALLIISVRFDRLDEELPPPSSVAVVFEGGKPEGPALPDPRPHVAAPSPPPAPTVPETAPPVAVRPPPSVQPAPLPVPPAPAPPPPPVAVEVPPPQPPPQVAVPAPPPPPPTTTGELPLPPPPPPLAMVVPRPPQPAPRPVPRPVPQQQPAPPATVPAPSRQQSFPAPMNFSFNAAPAAPRTPSAPRPASRGAPSTLDFSLAPRQGAADTTPFSRLAGMKVGPDWRNELAAWVRKHAYYPEQAAMNGEDGSATVEVVVTPTGRVTSVELTGRSGSQWLDLALQALFRDANLPPLHDETEPISFRFTMHYILIRTP